VRIAAIAALAHHGSRAFTTRCVFELFQRKVLTGLFAVLKGGSDENH
jgi:hypothetical protein